ncbi:hypothetical protein [Bradyrhizobium sp. Ai1a-2]|uniref:hypothetical protein n=1 Tax=Bradyrhizobium sp. Ai1a-2 TaxID=196490 RepID=UPI00047F1B8C|nr:hypothetical protein [Bradyrhizobium sp. Ai1a-2]
MHHIDRTGRRTLFAMGFIGLAGILSGCGAVAITQARTDYQESAANYKRCLGANASAPQNCEALRLVLETDERKYTAIGGDRSNSTVTVQNR